MLKRSERKERELVSGRHDFTMIAMGQRIENYVTVENQQRLCFMGLRFAGIVNVRTETEAMFK